MSRNLISPPLPEDVLGLITFYIEYKIGKATERVVHLDTMFVIQLARIIQKHNIPKNFDDVLPEPCRSEICDLIWEHVDELVQQIQNKSQLEKLFNQEDYK